MAQAQNLCCFIFPSATSFHPAFSSAAVRKPQSCIQVLYLYFRVEVRQSQLVNLNNSSVQTPCNIHGNMRIDLGNHRKSIRRSFMRRFWRSENRRSWRPARSSAVLRRPPETAVSLVYFMFSMISSGTYPPYKGYGNWHWQCRCRFWSFRHG